MKERLNLELLGAPAQLCMDALTICWPDCVEVRQKCRQVSVQQGLGGTACVYCRRWGRDSWALSRPVGREKERANQSRIKGEQDFGS